MVKSSTEQEVFGLKISQLIKTHGHGDRVFPITYFEQSDNGCWWAHLGHIDNIGYGERVWLIGKDSKSFWQSSKWKIL